MQLTNLLVISEEVKISTSSTHSKISIALLKIISFLLNAMRAK